MESRSVTTPACVADFDRVRSAGDELAQLLTGGSIFKCPDLIGCTSLHRRFARLSAILGDAKHASIYRSESADLMVKSFADADQLIVR